MLSKAFLVTILYIYIGFNISANVLLTLLNELGKSDKTGGLQSIFITFSQPVE